MNTKPATLASYSKFVLTMLLMLAIGTASGQQSDLRVDAERLHASWSKLRTIGLNDNGGSDRVAYSQYNKDALDYLSSLMLAAGLDPRIDVAGNLVGRKAGNSSVLAPIITGSHIDTVPNGGHYDGIVGSLGAIEVARTLHDAGYITDHPLEFIIWSNEEGGKTGSRSFNGSVTPDEMGLPSLGDRALGEGIEFIGGAPARLNENRRGPDSVAALIELHIEQGAILDRENVSIGVVEGIVGIRRWNITVDGFANHAGTTPMNQRRDAMVAAAQLASAINRIITSEPGSQVGTVGRIEAFPGAPNVVPGKVVMSLEIRDLSMEKIGRLFARIKSESEILAKQTDTVITLEQFYESPAAITDERFKRLINDVADELGLSSIHMPSGAGHDAQSLSGIAPLGMIFVPSVKGVSHAPTEFTGKQDFVNGANTLLQTIIRLDQQLR